MANFQIRIVGAVALLLALLIPQPALAEIPEPVRAMLDAAIASGDADTVEAVFDVAKQTNPDDAAEIDSMLKSFRAEQRELAAAQRAEKLQAVRNAGFFQLWSGKGEIGAFQSSGNSDNVGVSAALSLTREGHRWTHKLRGAADYQRADGVTSREQFFAAYEPRYRISRRLFVFGLGQYERDRFQGFSARYVTSGGLGYKIVDRPNMHLSAKAGPAYRVTQFVDGGSDDRIAGLVAMDFDWTILNDLKLTQDANMTAETGGQAVAIVDGNNTSLSLVTGLEAKISDRLTSRLSYTVEYDSNPPDGAVKTDTLSRFTLVYGF